MAKVSFFKKQGRQTKEEMSLINEIRSLRHRLNISDTDLRHRTCYDVNDLTDYVVFLNQSVSDSGQTFKQQDDNYTNETSSNTEELINENMEGGMGFNPLEDAVIERDYTSGQLNQGNNSDLDDELSGMANDFSSYRDPNDIPDAQFEEVSDEEEDDLENDGNHKDEEPLGGDNLSDMSPSEKRKAAKLTAKALVEGYASIKTSVGIKFCQYNEDELFKMNMKGEIDMNDEIQPNMTFADYVPRFNERVVEALVMTDEEKEAIIEPLTEVLLENELALTPTQRLILAVGQDLMRTGVAIWGLKRETKQIIEFMKENMVSRRVNSVPSQPIMNTNNYQSPNTHSEATRTSDNNSSNSVAPSFDPFASGESIPSFSMSESVSHEELLESMSKDAMDVINPDHDPTVEVTEE